MISMSPGCSSHALVAVATDSPLLRLCDIRIGNYMSQQTGHIDALLDVKWRPNNEYHLVSTGIDGTIRLWDVRRTGPCLRLFNQFREKSDHIQSKKRKESTGRPRKRFKYFKNKHRNSTRSHEGSITSLCFDSTGNILLSAGLDNLLKQWDVDTGTNKFVNYPDIENSNRNITSKFCCSINGDLIYFPNGSDIAVYETKTGKKVHTLSSHYSRVICCKFNPSLTELYSCGVDQQIHIWSPHQQEVDAIEGENDWSDSSSEDENRPCTLDYVRNLV
eukprot:TRINITY_DN8038_c1_g2_i1.p1 TRINITY_DN8038_c1_g2~~TRINITY_DN8038_c1_g2_i1.p1  ORF type:complete len:275 (-),score=32.42 TRINITY_DN8038_c1_g2_i1:124-948(-)